MSLKQEFLAALQAHEDFHALLALVRRHQAQAIKPRESYDVLHEIWVDFGFDESEEESPLRNDLEYVMEKVWFQGSNV
jgi:hypothetical protein